MKDTNNSIVTANQYFYNCMSYALGVFDDWLRLDSFERSFKDYQTINYEYMDNVFHDCCIELEENFSIRRLTSSKATLEVNERMIAFRIGADDFHFARRNSDGIWTHKPGGDYIREMSEDELFSEAWCADRRQYPYVSAIAFYAVKM